MERQTFDQAREGFLALLAIAAPFGDVLAIRRLKLCIKLKESGLLALGACGSHVVSRHVERTLTGGALPSTEWGRSTFWTKPQNLNRKTIYRL